MLRVVQHFIQILTSLFNIEQQVFYWKTDLVKQAMWEIRFIQQAMCEIRTLFFNKRLRSALLTCVLLTHMGLLLHDFGLSVLHPLAHHHAQGGPRSTYFSQISQCRSIS